MRCLNRFLSKMWGARNTPQALSDENKTCDQYMPTMSRLQDLRDLAWQNAIEYRFDPFVGGIHQEYLTTLNEILKGCEI